MRPENLLFILLFFLTITCGKTTKHQNRQPAIKPEKITFESTDGLTVTADFYHISDNQPIILLFHQARSSRGEFVETAKKLNDLGYNCMAVDLRSGSTSNGINNETAALAIEKNLPNDYISAENDIIASINFAFDKFHRKVILFGSSYSASLALFLAVNNGKVSAVIAFSPGEYFETKLNVAESIKNLSLPVFITSAKNEVEDTKILFNSIGSNNKVQFIPKSEGMHASKVLWPDCPSSNEYWNALIPFLKKIHSL